ncbi:MAG: T9SS type A sorting domain-containing protein, partial [Cyclobacteriaceae bacterium]
DEFFAVITLDTVFDGQSIEVKNNNIYWTDPIIDTWAKFDSVSSPNIYSATVAEAVGEENVDAIAISEELELNNVCGDISAYVDAFYATPDAAEFPENWCVGGEGGVFPDEVDASYADTYTSYTGGDDNFPIGDLNHFPDFLKAWSGPVIADLDNIVLESSGDSQNVSLSVTDARGLDVSITVSSSDESVATATYDNGEILVTAVANMGIATITVAASNGEVTTEENFIVSVGGVLSVEDELESNLLVYPNPTKGFTTFRYNMDKNDEMMVTLLDMNGRRLGILDSGTKTKGQHELKVDLGQYISNYGVYFAKFQTSDESNIMRLIYINK